MNKPELLAPAGDLQKLKTAFLYGADAVYAGGEEFSMRTACDNFSDEDLKRGIEIAHSLGKKIYIAVNVIMRNRDLDPLYHFVRRLKSYGADAVILSDPGAMSIVREAAPDLDIHISTQANIVNSRSANVWYSMGAKRVVLARELCREEVCQIRKATPPGLELEMFVHGAMCISYSGRCLLSNYMTGRDSNKGDCAQSCRWNYRLTEEKRPGEYYPVTENERGSFIFNSKDMCMIKYIPEIVESGVTSLKIEGRVKSEYYVATVTKAYREAIDKYLENPEKYTLDPKTEAELCKVSHRHYSGGFWHNDCEKNGQIYETSSYIRDYDVVGTVKSCDSDGNAVIHQRNKFSAGEEIEILRPKGEFLTLTISEMKNADGEIIQSAPHAEMEVRLKLPEYVPENSMLRRKRKTL